MSKNNSNYSEICRRYAKALLSLSKDNSEVENYVTYFKNLSNLINDNNEFNRFVHNPLTPPEKKIKILGRISKSLKINKQFSNFLKVLAKHNRLGLIKSIGKIFMEIIQKKSNQSNIEVITSVPLDKAVNKKLIEKFEILTGKKINIYNRIDKKILGGIIVKIGSIMIDSSIKTKLEKYQFSMKGMG